MTSTLERIQSEVLQGLRELHADTSGTPHDNLEAFQRVKEEVNVLIGALEADCRNFADHD